MEMRCSRRLLHISHNDHITNTTNSLGFLLNVSNMTHTALLGEIINTCHISIQLVKRFCKFVDLMLTSYNAIVRHFVRRDINSAQSLCVVDINVKHVHRQYPSSQQSYQEPPGVSWNYCACPITRLIYPGSPK